MKEEIGLRIKEIRESMNLTKEKLAKELGISGQYLGMIEKGKNYISIEQLKTLCELSNHSSDYILFGIPEKNETQLLLKNFSAKQIEDGCKLLKELAIFIKDN